MSKRKNWRPRRRTTPIPPGGRWQHPPAACWSEHCSVCLLRNRIKTQNRVKSQGTLFAQQSVCECKGRESERERQKERKERRKNREFRAIATTRSCSIPTVRFVSKSSGRTFRPMLGGSVFYRAVTSCSATPHLPPSNGVHAQHSSGASGHLYPPDPRSGHKHRGLVKFCRISLPCCSMASVSFLLKPLQWQWCDLPALNLFCSSDIFLP